jgi:quinoprotein glucose dehydrogenase
VEERAVPQSDVPGEQTWPTQPFPTSPPPLLPDLERPFAPWAPTESALAPLAEAAERYRYEGRFTPPSLHGSIQFPSTAGGFNWGGLTYDPERQIVVANINRIAHLVQMIPRDEFNEGLRAKSFRGESAVQHGTDYGLVRRTYLSPDGLPVTPPPWGLLMAIDLPTGKTLWQKPLGFLSDALADRGWGSPGVGGNIVTAGGLVFVAATFDGYLRAFDVSTGAEVWRDRLPVPAQSTPMTFRATPDGKQFVAICSGGHGKLGTELGDYVVAYALP